MPSASIPDPVPHGIPGTWEPASGAPRSIFGPTYVCPHSCAYYKRRPWPRLPLPGFPQAFPPSKSTTRLERCSSPGSSPPRACTRFQFAFASRPAPALDNVLHRLWGVTCVQTFSFFTGGTADRAWQKALVCCPFSRGVFLLIYLLLSPGCIPLVRSRTYDLARPLSRVVRVLDTFDTVLNGHILYFYLVSNYLAPQAILFPVW